MKTQLQQRYKCCLKTIGDRKISWQIEFLLLKGIAEIVPIKPLKYNEKGCVK